MTMIAAQWVIVLAGLWLVGISGFIFAKPLTALELLGQMASTNLIHYTEISLRMLFGIALLAFAQESHYPDVLLVAGVFIAASAAILFIIPRAWHARYSVYWANMLNSTILRICAPISVAAGVFLVYAVA